MASSKCGLETGSDEWNDGNDNTVSAIPKAKDLGQQFSTKTWREDMTLVVEGKQLYVASNILSLISPVFTAMFDELFGENGPREIELKDKSYDDVVEFLLCSYPNIQKNVDLDNVYAVVPLAKEYDVKLLTERCETALLSMVDKQTKTKDLCMHANKACTFGFVSVKEKCISLLSEIDIEKIRKVEEKLPLSHEVKIGVQRRIIPQLKKNNTNFVKVLRNVHSIRYSFDPFQMYGPDDSPAIFAHGISWKIQGVTSHDYDDRYLEIKLFNNSHHNVTPCRVRGIFLVHNLINEEDSICRPFEVTFKEKGRNDWGFKNFMKIIENEHKVFFDKDSKMLVEARFFVGELPMEIIK